MTTKKELNEEIEKLEQELTDNAEEYADKRTELEDKIEKLEEMLGQIRKHIKNLFDTIPIEMEKVGRKYEVYSIGTKKQWIEWFIKYSELVGLLGQEPKIEGMET